MKNIFTNRPELIDYLKSENNSYSLYILTFLEKKSSLDLKKNKMQKHHIIP